MSPGWSPGWPVGVSRAEASRTKNGRYASSAREAQVAAVTGSSVTFASADRGVEARLFAYVHIGDAGQTFEIDAHRRVDVSGRFALARDTEGKAAGGFPVEGSLASQ